MITLNAKKLFQDVTRHDRIGRVSSVWATKTYFSEHGFMKSTDNDIQITTNLNGELKSSATVDRKKLKELLKSLGDIEITIETSETFFSIDAGESAFTIENCKDWETKHQNEIELQNDSDYFIKLTKKAFLSYFRPLLSHAAENDVRYYLSGVLFDCDKKGDINLVATDGHRLLLNKIGGGDKSSKRIVSRRLIDIAVKSTTNYKDDVLINVGDIESSILIGDTAFYMKNIDGRYPDYERVIPKHDNQLVFDRKELLQALEEIKPFVTKRYRLARFLFDKKLSIQAEGNEKTVCFKGNPLNAEMGFNVDYMIDALKASNQATVSLSVYSSLSAVKITQDDSATGIVMPARLD